MKDNRSSAPMALILCMVVVVIAVPVLLVGAGLVFWRFLAQPPVAIESVEPMPTYALEAAKAGAFADDGDEIITLRLKLTNATADAMEAGDVQEVRRLVDEELELNKRWAAYCETTTESERRKLLNKYKDEQIASHERIEKAKPAYLRAAGVQPQTAVP